MRSDNALKNFLFLEVDRMVFFTAKRAKKPGVDI